MEKTITFKAEYTIQIDEKYLDKLKDENGKEKNFKKASFFAKNLVGKVKDFEMGE